jgi:cytochrome c biogenesis protein CcdA
MTYLLALVAGMLSTLAPCVLPLIPILAASALMAHRFGPLAMAGGLALSYAAVGLLLASAGSVLGLDPASLRRVGAVVLLLFGGILLIPALQAGFARAASVLSNAGQGFLERLAPQALGGQFLIGVLLGLVWSPCVGPTLGGAITLAGQGEHLAETGAVMLLFGLGAASPLLVLGSLSRTALQRMRGRLLAAGRHGRTALGTLFLVLGILMLTGADKAFEAWLLERMPPWLLDMTVSV